jgi:uncharacterized membrane protein
MLQPHAATLAAGLAVLLAADLLWVAAVMRPRYAALVRRVQGGRDARYRAWAAAAAYATLAAGFAALVHPRLDAARPLEGAVVHGGAYGLVLYGVYDFTNAALFAEWDVPLALVDVAWGGAVHALAALAALAAARS